MTLTPEIDNGMLLLVDENGQTRHVVSLDALAAWRQLLGLGSDVEAVAAIMQAQDPGVLDASTSRNAWTSAYEQCERERLLDLNQTVKAATRRAIAPVSHALVDDGRAETRRLLGLPSGSVMAMRLMDEDGEPPAQTIPLPERVDAQQLDDVLAGVRPVIDDARERFIADLIPPQPSQQ